MTALSMRNYLTIPYLTLPYLSLPVIINGFGMCNVLNVCVRVVSLYQPSSRDL